MFKVTGPEPIRIHPEITIAIPGGTIVRRCELSTCAHCGEVIVRPMRAGRGLWQHMISGQRGCALICGVKPHPSITTEDVYCSEPLGHYPETEHATVATLRWASE